MLRSLVKLVRFFLLCVILAESSVFSGAHAAPPQEDQNQTDPTQDFFIMCRLAERTNLIDYQGKVLAILGSDSFISMEDYIQNQGWVTFNNYVVQSQVGSTVRVSGGLVTIAVESVLLSSPSDFEGGILGLVIANQTFKIFETIAGGLAFENAIFHRIQLKGLLQFPVFTDCQRKNDAMRGVSSFHKAKRP